jgi:hypothetical protein
LRRRIVERGDVELGRSVEIDAVGGDIYCCVRIGLVQKDWPVVTG